MAYDTCNYTYTAGMTRMTRMRAGTVNNVGIKMTGHQ
jgi:hypothetical protein